MPPSIDIASTDEQILACFPVLAELRPHLVEDDFVDTIRRLMREQHYRLVFLSDDGVKAVAGIRIGEWLPAGKYLEIEDLVITDEARSHGYGGALFDWLLDHAAQHQCHQMRLVSAVRRSEAHRFYKRKGMIHEAHYFSVNFTGTCA